MKDLKDVEVLFTEIGDQSWRALAACKGTPVSEFYPPKGHLVKPAIQAMCAACPVRAECDQYAVLNQPDGGYWGGLSQQERKLRRKAEIKAGAPRRRPRSTRRSECPQGHALIGENLRVYQGRRECVTCRHRQRKDRYRKDTTR